MHLTHEELERLARITRFARPLGRYSETKETFGEVRLERNPETGVHHFPYVEYPPICHCRLTGCSPTRK